MTARAASILYTPADVSNTTGLSVQKLNQWDDRRITRPLRQDKRPAGSGTCRLVCAATVHQIAITIAGIKLGITARRAADAAWLFTSDQPGRTANTLYPAGRTLLLVKSSGAEILNAPFKSTLTDICGRPFEAAIILDIGQIIKTVDDKLISTKKDTSHSNYIKELSAFYTDEDRKDFASTVRLTALVKDLRAELAAGDAARDENIELNAEARIASVISGTDAAPPKPWATRRTEIRYAERDIEEALDHLAVKAKAAEKEAGRKMVADAAKQILASDTEVFSAVQNLFEVYLPNWQAKRKLLNHSIGTYGHFSSELDQMLGIPTDLNSAWGDLFRTALAKGFIKKMPAELSPRTK